MKRHLILKLRKEAAFTEPPHWSALVQDGKGGPVVFCPPVDAFFRHHQIPIIIAAEYQKDGDTWSEEDRESGFDRVIRIVLLKNTRLSGQQLQELAAVDGAKVVEYVYPGKVEHSPIPALSEAKGTRLTGNAPEMIYLKEAHEQFTQGHPGVTVAVLDTGIDLSHPELRHCLLSGFDFVDILGGAGKFFGDYLGVDDDANDEKVGHGTHVAGIIAARGIKMSVGVAPGCKILPVRVLGAMKQGDHFVGAGLVDNINNGIKWAVDQGVDIINMSLGIQHTGGGLPHKEVIRYAKNKGVTIVAASGNDGTETLYYPGALPHAISVGALDENGAVASFSTHGKVSLTAPGTQIYSSYIDDDYAFSSGTSQAAPFVAGLIALLKSYALKKGKKLNDQQVKYLLKNTCDRSGQQFKTRKTGYGTINAFDSLKLLNHKL